MVLTGILNIEEDKFKENFKKLLEVLLTDIDNDYLFQPIKILGLATLVLQIV